MSTLLIERLIDATTGTIEANVELLTELDQAVGDGDHGLNMRRGFTAIREARAGLSALPLAEALSKAGMLLIAKVGGAAGPLYGSLLLAMGKAGADLQPNRAVVVTMLSEAVAAVKKRGKSETREKTMLDVLVPVLATLQQGVEDGLETRALIERIKQAASDGLESTKSLRATKGRASFLGERSIGLPDPGAQSSCLLIHAICDVMAKDAA